MLDDLLPYVVILGCILFILFGVIKSVDVFSSLDSTFTSRGKAIFLMTFSQYRLFVHVVLALVSWFIGFTIILAFIAILIAFIQGEKAALKDVLLFSAKMFLGFFRTSNSFFVHLFVIPFLLLIIFIVLMFNLYNPKTSNEEDDQPEYVESTMKHYMFMIVLAMFFTASIYITFIYIKDDIQPSWPKLKKAADSVPSVSKTIDEPLKKKKSLFNSLKSLGKKAKDKFKRSKTPAPQGNVANTPAPQGNVSNAAAPQGNVANAPAPQGNVSNAAAAPQGNVANTPAPQGNVSNAAAPQRNSISTNANATNAPVNADNVQIKIKNAPNANSK